MSIQVTFIMRNGAKRLCNAEAGQSLLDVARANHIDEIEGTCGGVMACATCHVIVDPSWFNKLPERSNDEADMLDLAYGLTPQSRLGCQIKLTPALNGLIVKLPESSGGMKD